MLGSQTNVVTRTSDAHLHILGDLNFKIALRIFRFGLPSVELFKSLDESINALYIFLHFDQHLLPQRNDTANLETCSYLNLINPRLTIAITRCSAPPSLQPSKKCGRRTRWDGGESSEQRLARALLLLARFGKKDKAEEVVPDISQETLAEMVGTTRSRVNCFMNKFRKLGFIDYNDRLRVHIVIRF